jgi:Tol biopolymer transport system component
LAPAWPPDGTRIVFYSDRDGNHEVYVIAPDGTDLTRLTNEPETDGLPAWSPDGRKIVFWSRRDGNSEIYTMDTDGANVTRLTNHPKSDLNPHWTIGQVISPLGKRRITWGEIKAKPEGK